MRVSHEAIRQALHAQGRGALTREPAACLRAGRALRRPRSRRQGRGESFITPEATIGERPAEAADRAAPGRRKGDLILGLGRSALGAPVGRATRFTVLRPPPREARPRRRAPDQEWSRARRPWRRGAPRCDRARDRRLAPAAAPSADPGSRSRDGEASRAACHDRAQHPLLRSSQPLAARIQREHERAPETALPKRRGPDDLDAVAAALNGRPPRTLHWTTPADALDEARPAAQTGPVETAQYMSHDV